MSKKKLHLLIMLSCLLVAIAITVVALIFHNKEVTDSTTTSTDIVTDSTVPFEDNSSEPVEIPTAIEVDDGEIHLTDEQIERLDNLESLTVSENNVIEIPELVGYAEQDYGIESATEYMSYFSDFPAEVYCSQCESLGGTTIRLRYQIRNTDVITLVEFDNVYNPGETSFLDVCNMYGSDYSWVFWNNGVPENSEYYYKLMLLNKVPLGQYETDFVEGDTALTLTDVDGNTYSIDL